MDDGAKAPQGNGHAHGGQRDSRRRSALAALWRSASAFVLRYRLWSRYPDGWWCLAVPVQLSCVVYAGENEGPKEVALVLLDFVCVERDRTGKG